MYIKKVPHQRIMKVLVHPSKYDHYVAHTHKHQVLYQIFPNDVGEDPMSHNASPKIYNVHQYNQPCVLSSNKGMKNLHQNLNQIRSKENMKTSNGSKKSHQYTHEYVYHHNVTKDATTNVKRMSP